MSKRKTTQQFKDELYHVNDTIEIEEILFTEIKK